jgi:hypothetical protein
VGKFLNHCISWFEFLGAVHLLESRGSALGPIGIGGWL